VTSAHVRCSHLDDVVDADGCMPDWAIECLSQIFSSLSDHTRLRIVHALVEHERLNVTELAEFAGLSVSAVSHQLRILRDRNLVRGHRNGRMVFYSLSDDHVRTLFCTGVQHAKEDCNNSLRRVAQGAR
jgi:DNA-binding transcriptional ArsR family regulator